jgi:hypothetical protein
MSIDGSTVSVDHTAVPKEQHKQTTFGGSQSITVNRDIEPLLSKVVGGAAAAYSLRDLNDSQGNNNVVRVRRESDNSEKDFIAKEVSNGTMARWVNEQPTLPLDLRELDTNTGERDGALIEAAAAYSLRNLKAAYTGNVVEVRRSSDDAEESFTASEVADGTLEVWVGAGNDGFVRTWYDQSGSDNHAVQTDTAKQPKIVDAGTYLGEVDFDGTQHFETISGGILTNIQDTYSVWLGKRRNNSSGYLAQSSSASGGSNRLYLRYNVCTIGAEAVSVSIAATNDVNTIVSLTGSGGTYDGFKNGADVNDTEITASTGAGGFTLGASSTGLSPVDGTLKEFIVYDSDQTANRTAIEANIGETYGITEIPAADDTVNGFVQTWYDQSGSGNDAEQSAASSQPKIVGEVTSGQPHAFLGGLDFDGVDDELSTSSSFAPDQPITSFIVSNIGNAGSYFSFGASTTDFRFITSSAGLAALNAGTAVTSDVTVTGEETLLTAIGNTTASSIFKNGTSTGSGDIGTAPTGLDEGLKIGNWHINGRFADGAFKELIIYNSDQSSNRPAIEANINNQYDIY